MVSLSSRVKGFSSRTKEFSREIVSGADNPFGEGFSEGLSDGVTEGLSDGFRDKFGAETRVPVHDDIEGDGGTEVDKDWDDPFRNAMIAVSDRFRLGFKVILLWLEDDSMNSSIAASVEPRQEPISEDTLFDVTDCCVANKDANEARRSSLWCDKEISMTGPQDMWAFSSSCSESRGAKIESMCIVTLTSRGFNRIRGSPV
jgi:hypothetical protein